MPLWSRIANVFTSRRLDREIDEELASHIAEAIENGRDPREARAAFGSPLRQRERSHDLRVILSLDRLRSDVVFGWRQLHKRKVTSAAAILSLGLAVGACTSAFRLIDALLLRPLPVAGPDRLYALARTGPGIDGRPAIVDSWAYPDFELMREAARREAALIAVSYSERLDLTYRGDAEMEKAHVQYVSGSMFPVLGIRPARGRLLAPGDDLHPGAHPYAVISWDYWSRRFGADPSIVGKTFHLGSVAPYAGVPASGNVYQIVGVAERKFTGTEPGTVIDVFLPAMMHPGATHDDWTWMRTLALVKPGAALEPLRAKLDATTRAFEENRARGFKGMPKETIAILLSIKLIFEPAAAGISDLQQTYRRSLIALAVLVALVLLIACANVANLMSAQAAARAREMALRVSIGAGRWRLVQLVLVESAMLAALSALVGAVFAWWSAPFVVNMINPPDNPARLILPADGRVLVFGLLLTSLVTLLFGLAPALRASALAPVTALKGGSAPHSRRRLMRVLIAVQVAFCSVVLFGAGLFASSFDRLSKKPVGFVPERLLLVEAMARAPQPASAWNRVADQLRTEPGVQSVAIAGWPLLTNHGWNGFISPNGAPPKAELGYFLAVSPGWLGTMKLPILAGRDFRYGEKTGVAIVNQTFARTFFGSEDVVGKFFNRGPGRYEISGLVRDAPYKNLRESILPQAYLPFEGQKSQSGVFVVRTAIAAPLALSPAMRRAVPAANAGFRVSNITTQAGLLRAQTLRERLLAALGLFFAGLALLLAAIGLYGVLEYSVLQRRREIGIRMAIGARAPEIARRVTADILAMVLAGACGGLAIGIVLARYIETLLYGVQTTDAALLTVPSLVIVVASLAAAVPAAIRAVRTDPVKTLRVD
ncbi:MAG: ABC transporter permease [Acidobacteriota bacterium]|nr:ABC transporter permease [Acidobacteriota bacterium]